MLSKQARLRAAEVREIIKSGKSLRSSLAPHISLKYIKNTTFRAAIVVSKSIARNAVERNRIRRAAYQALKDVAPVQHVRVVLFVQKLPATPLLTHLRSEAQSLIHSL